MSVYRPADGTGPYTGHGHAVAGITVVGVDRPGVARCGGPALCSPCALDAARIRADHAAQAPEPRPHLYGLPERDGRCATCGRHAVDPVHVGVSEAGPDEARVVAGSPPVLRTDPALPPTAVWVEPQHGERYIVDVRDRALTVHHAGPIEELGEEILRHGAGYPNGEAQSAVECATVMLRRYRLGSLPQREGG